MPKKVYRRQQYSHVVFLIVRIPSTPLFQLTLEFQFATQRLISVLEPSPIISCARRPLHRLREVLLPVGVVNIRENTIFTQFMYRVI